MALNRGKREGVNNPTFKEGRKQGKIWIVQYGRRSFRTQKPAMTEEFWHEGDARSRVEELKTDPEIVKLGPVDYRHYTILLQAKWDFMTPEERSAYMDARDIEAAEAEDALQKDYELAVRLRAEIHAAIALIPRPDHITLQTHYEGGNEILDEVRFEIHIGETYPLRAEVNFPDVSYYRERFRPVALRIGNLSRLEEDQIAAIVPAYQYALQLASTINGLSNEWPHNWR